MINQGNLIEALTKAYKETVLEEHTDYQSFQRSIDRKMYEFAMQVHSHDVNRSNLLQSLQWHCLINTTDNQEIHVPVKELEPFCTEMRLKVKEVLKLSEGIVEKLEANGQVWRRANRVESQFIGKPYAPRKAQDSPEFIVQRQKELKDQQARQRILDEKAYKSPPPMKPIKTYASFH